MLRKSSAILWFGLVAAIGIGTACSSSDSSGTSEPNQNTETGNEKNGRKADDPNANNANDPLPGLQTANAANVVTEAQKQLVAELNRKDSSVRQKILGVMSEACETGYCEVDASDAYANNTYTFSSSDVAGFSYLGQSMEDLCPKEECSPQESGADQYIAVLRLQQPAKWAKGVSAIVVEVKHTFQNKASDTNDGTYEFEYQNWEVSFAQAGGLARIIAQSVGPNDVRSQSDVVNDKETADPTTAQSVENAKEQLLADLNKKDSELRKSVLTVMNDACVYSSCYERIGQAIEDGSFAFSNANISVFAYLGENSQDNCPKEECSPASSGSDAYAAILRVDNVARWASSASPLLIQVRHIFDSNDTEESKNYKGWTFETAHSAVSQ